MFEELFRGLDPAIYFAVSVFGNTGLGPLSKYYQGYREEKNGTLDMAFENGYVLRIEKELVADIFEIEERRYCWQLLHQEDGCEIMIDDGEMTGDPDMGRIALARNILRDSIQKVFVKGDCADADADWTITAAEAETLYQAYGPFRMVFEEQAADIIWVRGTNPFCPAEEYR